MIRHREALQYNNDILKLSIEFALNRGEKVSNLKKNPRWIERLCSTHGVSCRPYQNSNSVALIAPAELIRFHAKSKSIGTEKNWTVFTYFSRLITIYAARSRLSTVVWTIPLNWRTRGSTFCQLSMSTKDTLDFSQGTKWSANKFTVVNDFELWKNQDVLVIQI